MSKTTYKRVKVWWARNGDEGFTVKQLWMNGGNARMFARSNNFTDEQNYKVSVAYVLIPSKKALKGKKK